MYILKNGDITLVSSDQEIIFKEGVWYSSEGGFSDPDKKFVLEIKPDVPPTITNWQAELILHDMGMLDTIQAIVNADPALSIVYYKVSTFDRSNGLITQVATDQNIPDDVIDQMFIAASRYTAEMATDLIARQTIMREVGLIQ